jgi:3-hydroxybutyryl-CoA dehydratase
MEPGPMRPFAHERFSREISLSMNAVSAYAHAVGDSNPLHHDADFAMDSRFGRPIASGTYTTALLLALTASHYSGSASMLGLEFWVKFRKAVFADETIQLEWLVVSVVPNGRLKGDIVDLRGRIRNQRGETAVGAKGKILVTELL